MKKLLKLKKPNNELEQLLQRQYHQVRSMPFQHMFLAKLQEDRRCRACHKKPEKKADGLTVVLKNRQEEGNCWQKHLPER